MNQFFSPSRFAHFLRWEILGNPQRYLYWFLTIYLSVLCLLQLNAVIQYSGQEQPYYIGLDVTLHSRIIIFFLIGVLFLTLAPSFLKHATLHDKAKRLEQLMLPVSTLERYVAHWIICTIGHLAIYITAFMLADATNLMLLKIYYPLTEGFMFFPMELIFGLGNDKYGLITNCPFARNSSIFISFVFLFQSVYFFASYLWSKISFIKITLVIIFFLFSFILVFRLFLMDELATADGNDQTTMPFLYNLTLTYLCTAFFLILGYFRLKEAEATPRW